MDTALIAIANTCHRLKKVRVSNDVGFMGVSEKVDVMLKCGEKYGILRQRLTCECCNHTSINKFYFELHPRDEIISLMKPIKVAHQHIHISLPDGTRGRFRKICTTISDEDILECLTYDNDDNYEDDETTVCKFSNTGYMFESLQISIKIRGAFNMFRKTAHRSRVKSSRLMALNVLMNKYDIGEVGIRALIIKYARLW